MRFTFLKFISHSFLHLLSLTYSSTEIDRTELKKIIVYIFDSKGMNLKRSFHNSYNSIHDMSRHDLSM